MTKLKSLSISSKYGSGGKYSSLKDNIQTLKYFGLSYNQAKVYLIIGSKKFCTVREIQERAEVPRQEIYRILDALEEFGLVEKTIKRPLRFRGIPVKQGVSFLLKQKIQETRKMKTKAEDIIKNFHLENKYNKVQNIKPNFVLIPKDAAITKRREEIENAEIEIDVITSWKRCPWIIFTFEDIAKKALARGVKIRGIIETSKELDQIEEQIHEFKKYPNFELRYILKTSNGALGIFDNKRAIVITSTSVGLAETPDLWTDNPCFLSILSDYFEIKWDTSLEYIPEQIC